MKEFRVGAIISNEDGAERIIVAYIENARLGDSWLVETRDGQYSYPIPDETLRKEWTVIGYE